MNWRLVDVKRSSRPEKKWTAIFENRDTGRTRTTHFGAAGMEDYTQHKDKERRERYRMRHAKDLRTDDPTRAGFLSMYLLWGPSSSLAMNIREYKKRFNL